MPFPEKKIPNI